MDLFKKKKKKKDSKKPHLTESMTPCALRLNIVKLTAKLGELKIVQNQYSADTVSSLQSYTEKTSCLNH